MSKWQINPDINSWYKEICPRESVEHHKEHRRRNREIIQCCLGPVSKHRGNSYLCIARHNPLWAGFRSWVRRHQSLYISITGDGVRARSYLISKLRIWQENNVCWKSLTRMWFVTIIVEKTLICIYHVLQHENIAMFLSAFQRFGSAFFRP